MQRFKTGIESESGSEIVMVVMGDEVWFEDEYSQIESFPKELIIFAAKN